MITRTTNNDAVMEYLERDRYTNLNILGHLKNNRDAGVYLYDDDLQNGVIVGGEELDFFFLGSSNPDFLNEFWDMLPPGHKCFSGAPKHIARVIQKDRKVEWENPCKVFALKGEFKRTEDARYCCESLTEADAEEVDKYYTYRSDHSLLRIRDNIARYDSSCIRVDGQLASWCAIHAEDSSMGPQYTKEEFRGLGMAAVVTSWLMEKLIARDITPFVQIIEHNSIPLHAITKLCGMEYTHDCAWFGVEK